MTYIHETAIIDEDAHVGEGTSIWHWVHVCAGARIGKACVLGQNVFVAGTVRIGDGVRIQNNVSLYDGVIIEDDVFLGPSVVFTNVKNPRAFVSRKDEYQPTVVRKGATIGANATIICGMTIGAHAFVGAGSVVTRDVPEHALVLGNPAHQAGWVCHCGESLGESEAGLLGCARCRSTYAIRHGRLVESSGE